MATTKEAQMTLVDIADSLLIVGGLWYVTFCPIRWLRAAMALLMVGNAIMLGANLHKDHNPGTGSRVHSRWESI
jgi:hypothetical protein